MEYKNLTREIALFAAVKLLAEGLAYESLAHKGIFMFTLNTSVRLRNFGQGIAECANANFVSHDTNFRANSRNFDNQTNLPHFHIQSTQLWT
ncbi:MAG: hypothetical protein L3J22_04500 [Xanthomonadales bacterium]|nr:hypothetical protein [Xanthomonadales bacterium]